MKTRQEIKIELISEHIDEVLTSLRETLSKKQDPGVHEAWCMILASRMQVWSTWLKTTEGKES